MDKETLYDLRSLLALYPYYQTARLLLLQNLYLLHDPSFDEELRRSAVYVTDREVVFNLVEAAHYKLHAPAKDESDAGGKAEKANDGSRTISLIDKFLDSIPADSDEGKPILLSFAYLMSTSSIKSLILSYLTSSSTP